jgi:hypothetical protein
MGCKHIWDREFLVSNFKKSFINGDLKKKRETVLFEIEKGLLPETQPFAENAKEIAVYEDRRARLNRQLSTNKRDLHNIQRQLFTVQSIANYETLMTINNKISATKEELKFIANAVRFLRIQHLNQNQNQLAEHQERRTFIKPCPSEGCRGFLSTAWKCGLCSVKVCNKCHEIKNSEEDTPEHVCKPENIATVEAMVKDSKPCPKCGSMIQRIDGCPQMFHTPLSGGCGAVFDWNTLRIQNGAVHNPHWYEYQRHLNGGAMPRNVGDVPCGGMPNLTNMINTLTILVRGWVIDSRGVVNTVSIIHRAYNHNQFTVLPAYTVNMVADNRNLRIDYLLERIDEKKFKQQIQMREKAREKKAYFGNIIGMYQTAIVDIMGRLMVSKSITECYQIMDEFTALVQFANDCFKKGSEIFTCVHPVIDTKTFIVKR